MAQMVNGVWSNSQPSSRRRLAEALMLQGSDTSPVQHWSQGLNRIAQAMIGGYESYKLDQEDKEAGAIALSHPALTAGGGAAPAAAPSPTSDSTVPVGSTQAQPMGNVAIPAGSDEFINSVMPLAMEASKRTGIDPRIIVAQAALESNWGKSAPGNNLFGIKSHGQPGGNVMPTTEVVNGQPVRTTASFRSYASPADSVAGYADFMLQNPRYAGVRGAQGLDAQIAALGQSGYATDPQYGAKVGQIARGLPAMGAPGADPAAVPPGQTMAPTPQMQAPPQQVAQAPAMQAGNPTPQMAPAVAAWVRRAIANPATRQSGMQMLSHYTKPTPAPTSVQEFEYAQRNPAFAQRQLDLKAASRPQVTVDQRGEGEFTKEAGKIQAKRFGEIAEDGATARQMLSDIDTLRTLGAQIGTGKEAQIKAALGPYAQMFGMEVAGLNEIQAYEAIVQRLAPNLRVKGSGAQSDYELRNFLKSLPSIGNLPGGNELVSRTLEGLYRNKVLAADIGSRALSGEISRTDAEKQLRELPDPMKDYREFVKNTNPRASEQMNDMRKRYGLE